ncbi:nucleotide sugar dehydrogenase [Herbiconiux sp. SYSU D00978]|uniref:nucleotide sugar dehydrogenase n=1 Tax=Herbiconiux sp. SYSU D00978 TaxID=2812562 RepID=UPI0027DD9795|nr:nucleotide sugar dehydrogenase [Herbiconiux sp. SYSU D00978]
MTLTTRPGDAQPTLATQPLHIPTSRRQFDYDVAIVGLGYVGLPTALAFHSTGSRVLALDISQRRISAIRSGDVDLLDVDHRRLAATVGDEEGWLLTDEPAELVRAAAIVICVPTPVDSHLTPDLTMLKSACAMVVDVAVSGQLIMLTSTTYVGSTEDLIVEPLRSRGHEIGHDVFVAFSAERIDPGNARFDHDEVPRVMGAATPQCEELAFDLLSRSTKNVHRVHSLAAAEMTKLLENTFRAVNIALANEFADICNTLDIPVTEVIDAAATKPYGFMKFSPGPGVGGHCIPCDPHYLLWQLREQRVAAPVITSAMTEIAARPHRIVARAKESLAGIGVPPAGARVLVVGVTYKPDVADLRESPALEILAGLHSEGSVVAFLDPHASALELHDGTVVERVDDPVAFDPDLVLLHTRHSDADLSWVRPDQLVLDATYREVGVGQRIVP